METLRLLGRNKNFSNFCYLNGYRHFTIKRGVTVNRTRSMGSDSTARVKPGIKPSSSRVVFSGIQPTGVPHIGNYFGAIQHWVKLQKQYSNVIYSIVDLHAITLPHNPQELRRSCKENIREMVACLLACGIDPNKCILFQQSSLSQHAELAWILGCITTLPRLQHLPQWKEKSSKMSDGLLGIFTYPVLQSADILLYKATDVPVGDDQVKHIELTRHLANKFNKTYGHTFPKPMAIVGDLKRIKSLRNPSNKMSKSEEDPRSRIELTDTPVAILDKCRKAVTDFTSHVSYNPVERPGVSNLVDIYAGMTGMTPDGVVHECRDMDTLQFKTRVAEVVIEHLNPITKEVNRLKKEEGHIDDVLKKGADRAREIAQNTYDEVRHKIGFV